MGRATPYLLILPSFLMAAFIIFWPLYQIGQISLHDVNRFGQLREFAGLANFQALFADRIGQGPIAESPFPGPGVRPDERAQRLALEEAQRRRLAGGDGRPPIEEAMQAIAAKGAQAFDPLEVPP